MTPSDRDATGLLTRPDHFVQLVTPTGERRADPEFDRWVADVDADALSRLYRDMVDRAPPRRRGHRAAAPGRARPLAAARRPGGRADRLRAGAPRRRLRVLQLPRARRGLVPRRRPRRAAPRLARRPRHPAGTRTTHGMAVPQIIIGAQALHATGWAMGAALGRARMPRASRTSATARRARATSTRRSCSPRASTRPSSSSARTTSGRSPSRWGCSRSSRSPAAPTASACPGVRVDGNDVLAVLAATRDRARPRPPRRGPDVHRGRHLPHGPAHHGRRPEALPHRRRARRVAHARPDRAAARRCSRHAASTPRRSSARSPRRPTARRPSCAPPSPRSPTPSR